MKHKVILVIRDGWGYREECEDNCICQTPTPRSDQLMNQYPHTLLDASGEAVGLPDGYQGNSEVGHLTIGSGRVIFQAMVRINKAIRDGSFFTIPELTGAIENCQKHHTALHLIGLLQVEGVHAHRDHLFALLDLCKKMDFTNICIHLITDGRDAPVTDSLKHATALQEKLDADLCGRIVSVCGRYYAMDREKHWERTRVAYDCVVKAKGKSFTHAIDYIKSCHAGDKTDEFLPPGCIEGYQGIQENDSFIFYNFRTDRPRQLTQAIVEPEFEGWDRSPLNIYYVAMTQFYEPMNAHAVFKDQNLDNLLGPVVASAGLRQLRISEYTKYAHVTFFFNGQIEVPNKGEERIMIDSPDVDTYDLKPEMSVYGIRDTLLEQIRDQDFGLIVVNLVNCDMVGHTAIPEAITQAVAAVDECTGDIIQAGLKKGYTIFAFADHGNAEDQTPKWRTSHTTNPVPCILVSHDETLKKASLKKGMGLKDIAPTVLRLMGIDQPEEMTGKSIINT
jgi:2,3-bisphosphoglycerate-independent phosphoglycerate mutase